MRRIRLHSGQVAACILLAACAFLLIEVAIIPITGPVLTLEQGGVFIALCLLYNLENGCRRRRKRPVLRLSISVLTMFLTIRYLGWRIGDTLPWGFGALDLTLGLILLLAELHGIITSLMGQIINVLPLERTAQGSGLTLSRYPTVDVLIPTLDEDAALVETTLIAATQFEYPASRYRVYILDDGGTEAKLARPGAAGRAARERAAALRRIAKTYGATYLSRPANFHAKAGNINHALSLTEGELVLILDCDHVPAADFLTRTVRFFEHDPKLFVVQTPHNFVTPDPIERNLSTFEIMPTENELFYEVMQPGLDFWGASFFCGSAALLRRSVLEELGGMSYESITEDAETTLKAMRAGYRTAFYNRPMVSGLQPETFAGFILQRMRWAQGMVQIFLLDNVWRKPGLSFMQRVLFTNFAFYWLFPIARLILLIMPPLFLVFGFNIAATTPRQLLLYGLPYYAAAVLNSQYFYGRVRWPFISQIYETAQAVFLAAGMVFVLFRPRTPTFRVTPKGGRLDRDFISGLAWPFYCLLGIALASLGIGLWRAVIEPQVRWALIFVSCWVFLDIFALLGVIGALAERRQVRLMARINCHKVLWIRPAGGEWREARTFNLSRYGAGIVLPGDFAPVEEGGEVELLFDDPRGGLAGTVQYLDTRNGQRILGVRYRLGSLAEVRFAVAAAFGSSASLARTSGLRHRGVSVLYAFGFFVRIGLLGARRHLALLAMPWKKGSGSPDAEAALPSSRSAA